MNKWYLRNTFVRAVLECACAGLLSMILLSCIYELWRADFTVPFKYGGEPNFGLAQTKGLTENGWILSNPCLGAPDGCQMHDFPSSDALHYLCLKLIAAVTGNYVAAYNIYFLLGFPLAAVTALGVLRHFKVPFLPATAAALLFAFQPYHFYRSEGHLFLASYYLVPCLVMVALWIYLDRLPAFSAAAAGDDGERRPRRRRLAASVLICVFQASAGVYYAFFACYLFLVAGAAAALTRRRLSPLFVTALLIGVTGAGVFANIGNHFLYDRRHGPNHEVARRDPLEAEVYGMKIAQLLLPIPGHRIGSLAQKRAAYNAAAAGRNETAKMALGAAASIGFCVLIGALLCGQGASEAERLWRGLSLLNVFALLLATIGGFGMLFNAVVTPQIRCYNRLSIFLAFFGLFAVALAVQSVGTRFTNSALRKGVFALLLAGLVGLGMFDQTPKDVVWDYAALRQNWQNDERLVLQIESALPPGAMVYQMPFVPYPEWPRVERMDDYDHFRGYLHSRQLRWSYGAVRGRPSGKGAEELSLLPVEELVPELVRLGFAGIWVDRFAYQDGGADIEQRLYGTLQTAPLVSDDQRLVFYDMTACAEGMRRGSSGDAGGRLPRQARRP